MSGELAVACVPLTAGFVGSGALIVRTVRSVGALLVFAGLGLTAALLVAGFGPDRPGAYLSTGAITVVAAVGVAAYPRPRSGRFARIAFAVVGVTGLVTTATLAIAGVLALGGLVLVFELIAVQWWRYETGDAADRRAVLWFALTAGVASIVYGFAVFLASPVTGTVIGALVYSLVGPGLAVGLLLPEFVDVRGLVVRAVVFGVAVIAYIAIFVGIEATVSGLDTSRPSVGLLAVLGAFAAATFHPLQVVLRGVIDELLFGARPDPLRAATRVVDRIADDPVLALAAIREALVLPYASLRVDGLDLATSGTAVTHTRRLPLGDGAGEIVVGLRVGDLTLSAGDENVLRIVAPLLAQTLRAQALAADLQEAREHTVALLEEERRRLRRDLHDGLGPTLSGIAFTADAARNTLRSEPDTADALLRRVRTETVAAVGEIRRLVYAMRPPALDELGLTAALRQQAALIETASGPPLQVEFVMPAQLPPLPAAIEVAAYRIVLEALANTGRHSGTAVATVRLAVFDGVLRVEVSDDGRSAKAWTAGVGMASMRERADEVGGALTAAGGPNGGRVLALLPLVLGAHVVPANEEGARHRP